MVGFLNQFWPTAQLSNSKSTADFLAGKLSEGEESTANEESQHHSPKPVSHHLISGPP